MKKLITQIACILVVLSTSIVQAQQVGVNTNDPKATFQVVGQPTTTTVPDGVIAPNLTRNQLNQKSSVYTTSQKGSIVYVTTLDGTATDKTIDVSSIGYYYFDGSIWVAFVQENPIYQLKSYTNVTSTVAYGTSFTDATYTIPTFTPKKAKSTIIIELDANYFISGYFNDIFTIALRESGTNFYTKDQSFANNTGGGTRSSVVLPTMYTFTNTSLTPKNFSFRIFRASGDDNVTLYSSFVKVTEVEYFSGTSGGTADVTNYYSTSACTGTTGTIVGNMSINYPVSGVTMTIYANVTSTGTYNISTNTQSGITFSGTGTFTSTGCQPVVLTATGTPTNTGSFTWTTNTSPSISATATIFCYTIIPTVEVTSPTGKIWMDRNLGALQVATSATDSNAYGSLFQWGRLDDKHQCRTSTTTSTLSTSDVPGHSQYIISNTAPFDWRNPQNNSLWQGVSGINNPCPSGFRLPTTAEFTAEMATWSSQNIAGAFSSPLKLQPAGLRDRTNGNISNTGTQGSYWTSTPNGAGSEACLFTATNAQISSYLRSVGVSVRCIKN